MKKNIVILALIYLLSIPIFAQFGKNKIQYQNFNWRYIQTKHFDIYFHDNNKTLAVFTGIIAENALESIQRTLKYKVSHRFPIIVYNSHNQFQQTNVIDMYLPEGVGGVTELFKNRVVLPFEGDYEQFRHVIHHELVHAVINDWFYGGTFQSAISRGNLVEIPIWMNEGLCEWESIGGMDITTDVYIRDLTLSENLPNLQKLDGYDAYRGGQTFWWYVSERYGKHKIPELLNKYKSTGNLDNAFKATFNMKLEDFSNEWKKYLKKYYYPDIDKFSYPSDFAIKLTDHKKKRNFYNTSPAISPQGDKVAFIADKDGLFSLFILEIDKNRETEIVSSFRQQDFEELNVLTPGISWNPDGTKLCISAKYRGEDVIYIVDINTKNYERLQLGFHQISSVAWSPKDDIIAFSATVLDRRDIFIYNLKSKTIQRLTNDLFYDDHPVWSSDGKNIFFVSSRGEWLQITDTSTSNKPWLIDNSSRDIFKINLASLQLQRITFTPAFNKTSLAISPDDNFLYFVSDQNGIGNIYKLEFANNKIKPITNSLSNITQISISKITENLVFAALTEGGFDLFLLKNPSSISLNIDSLPLTKFRFSQLSTQKIDTSKVVGNEQNNTDPSEINISYGKFKVDFSRQNFIPPNKDVKLYHQDYQQRQKLSDTDFVDYGYKLKFTPDLILGNPYYNSFWGFQGLAQMLFSDILGDHQIYLAANLWLDLKNSNFYLQYSYLPNVIDYHFSAFQSSILFSLLSSSSGYYETYRLRNYGLGFTSSYPMSLFNRFEFNVIFFNASKENISNVYEETVSRTIIFPTVKYVYDDVLYGSFAPVRGSRYYVEFRAVPKVFKNSINFFTLKFDYRKYWDFGYFLKLAFRGTGATSFGSNPQSFYLGGVDNWINYRINNNDNFLFQNPEDFAFMELITPLRGWGYSDVVANHFFASNIELRFPLLTALLPGPVPIVFNDILGVVFCDIGGGWSGSISNFKFQYPIVNYLSGGRYEVEPNRLLLSLGFGARAWILGLPVKLDIAWRKEYHSWSKPQYLFSIDFDL